MEASLARTLLHIDASARSDGSVSRTLTQHLVETLSSTETEVITRDIGLSPLPILSEAWVGANFTPDEARTEAQNQILALSDTLIAEIEAADTLVLGFPIYNFGVPAGFKAWIDLIARAALILPSPVAINWSAATISTSWIPTKPRTWRT